MFFLCLCVSGLFNLRGLDIPFHPFFYSYTLLTNDEVWSVFHLWHFATFIPRLLPPHHMSYLLPGFSSIHKERRMSWGSTWTPRVTALSAWRWKTTTKCWKSWRRTWLGPTWNCGLAPSTPTTPSTRSSNRWCVCNSAFCDLRLRASTLDQWNGRKESRQKYHQHDFLFLPFELLGACFKLPVMTYQCKNEHFVLQSLNVKHCKNHSRFVYI